jgi:Tfp pilus assembly protein PilF
MHDPQIESTARRAFEAFQAERHVLGLALTDQLIEDRPRDPVFRCWRAQALLKLGNHHEAVEEALVAIDCGPRMHQAHLALACAACADRQLALAEQAFQQAVRLSNYETVVFCEYANFMAFERGARAAERIARRAIAMCPDSSEAWAALGMSQFRRRRPFRAEESLRHALELNPNSARSQIAMSALLNATGRPEKALALADLMEDNPKAAQFVPVIRRQARRQQDQQDRRPWEFPPNPPPPRHKNGGFAGVFSVIMLILSMVAVYVFVGTGLAGVLLATPMLLMFWMRG